jgi:hypothetical protein
MNNAHRTMKHFQFNNEFRLLVVLPALRNVLERSTSLFSRAADEFTGHGAICLQHHAERHCS